MKKKIHSSDSSSDSSFIDFNLLQSTSSQFNQDISNSLQTSNNGDLLTPFTTSIEAVRTASSTAEPGICATVVIQIIQRFVQEYWKKKVWI